VLDDRSPRQWVKDLWNAGTHARPLTGGQDDGRGG
jgi:hypothetical protein